MTEVMLGSTKKAKSIWLAIGRFEGDAAIELGQEQRATIAYGYKSRPNVAAKGYADGKRFEVLSSTRSELTGMIVAEIEFVAD